MSYTVAKGPLARDYIITFADGRVLVVNRLDVNQLASADGTADNVIDVYGLLANSNPNGGSIAEFTSASGAAFTVAAGGGNDDYIITFADGSVVVVDGQSLSQLASLDGTADNVIDVDGLLANSNPNGGAIAEFTSASGAAFTVAAGGGFVGDYIITFADGSVVVVDTQSLSQLSSLDGTADNVIDVDGLLANSNPNGGVIAQFTSASGDAFTVAAGGAEDDYIITFADGRVLVVDTQSLSRLDSLDGTADNVIDVDGLHANSDPNGGAIAEFTSASGAAFTVAAGGFDDDYIITFADGRVLVVDNLDLRVLSSQDGTADNVIDVDGLLANSDPNGLVTAEFTSASGAAFTVAAGGFDRDYIITFADGRVVVVDSMNFTGPGGLDSGDGTSDNVIDVDGLFANSNPNGFLLANFLCFAQGTWVTTPSGQVPIEELAAGDMVVTMDHGPQPIRWIGSSKRPATGNMAPILIRKGALGNTRDLRVSPQHRMLLSGWQAEVLFGESEVLATAKSLVNDHSILREEGDEVEYFHMLFDTHEIVYAEGAPSESFHPGAEGWKALDKPTRNEILELFPQLANGNFDSDGPSARASLNYKEGSLLSHSMISQTQH